MHFPSSCKRFQAVFVLCLAGLPAATLCAEDHKYLKAFPKATDGMERFVIELPHKERGEEDDFRIELIAGKTMMTDGVNRYSVAASIDVLPLKGWGFQYYEVNSLDAIATTRMAAGPNAKPVEAFVSAPSKLIRYNSRVPIVVYLPKGGELRYRVWTTSKEAKSATRK